MTALTTVLKQHGGWPMSMFLTAEGKPIFGGTYWPPDDREVDGEKVRGFKTILKLARELHRDKAAELRKQADVIAERTVEALSSPVRGVALIDLDQALVGEVVDGLKEQFDKEYGGFGSPARGFRGTKFPTPPYLVLLQHEAERTKAKELAEMVDVTLDHMARGGIYDHLGGGFHRYSTERTWTVPHFEKMLYDNAQLAEIYANAYRVSKNPQYRRVLQESLAFVARELTSPEGAFYSALDADVEGEEGKFYVWTAAEIDKVLGNKADAELLKAVYSEDGAPN